MGWWSKREPVPKEPDAIDQLCSLLVERWWEWKPFQSSLIHLSGMHITFGGQSSYRDRPYIHFGMTSISNIPETSTEDRLWKAYQKWLVAKVSGRKTKFSDTAIALANAVLVGDTDAAIGLADWVKENIGER